MEKTIYVVLAVLVAAALGATFTILKTEGVQESVTFLDEYDQRIENALGLKPTEDVSYLLKRPDLPLYNYFLEPDQQTEYLIYLKGNNPLNNRNVYKFYKEIMEEYQQWFYIYGNRDTYWSFVKENANIGVFYDQLVLGLMLVTYEGRARKSEDFQQINQIAERLATEFDLTIEYVETIEAAVTRSQKLSAFYQEFNQWVTLSLEADVDRPFKGRELHDAFIGLGLEWGDFNNYHWTNSDEYVGDKHLLSVANMENQGDFVPEDLAQQNYSTSGIVAGFYLPLCAAPVEVYENLVTMMKYLQERFGGTIINYEGQVMYEDELDRIKIVIGEMAQEMEDYGIKPGHPQALWLFD